MTNASSTDVVPSFRQKATGDLYTGPILLNYRRVAEVLDLPNPKDVYELPIPRVRISPGRVRWASSDVQSFIGDRMEDTA